MTIYVQTNLSTSSAKALLMTKPIYVYQKAFSLVELLGVIAIISLITGLSSLAISGLSKSRNLANGGNLVVNLAQQARQNSLTKNSLTALVLATTTPSNTYNLKIFCLMELVPGATQWTQISAWQALPQGIVVDSTQSVAFFNPPTLSPALPDIPFQGTSVTQIVYQVFNPDGSLYVGSNGQPASSPVLKLIPNNSGSGNYYNVSLNTFTGIPRAERP